MPTESEPPKPPNGFPWIHFYFLAKMCLHLHGDIHLQPLANLFFLVLLLPWPRRWPGRSLIAAVRPWALFLAGLGLLWSESWLPPLRTLAAFLADSSTRPSLGYILEFLRGFVNFRILAGLAGLTVAVAAASRWRLRLTPASLLLLAVVVVADPSLFSRDRVTQQWTAFCRQESKREVRFDPAALSSPDFDLVIIHVCSLSWDDLRATGLLAHPFFSHFDYLFTRFNSASSYSNPSALRVLRAPCGQTSHADLFKPAPDGCYLTQDLRRLGYQTYAAFNHEALYAHMGEVLTRYARLDTPMDVAGLPIAKLNFDDAPIFDDGAALDRWLSLRQASGARKAALYYNTLSLHRPTPSPPPGPTPGRRTTSSATGRARRPCSPNWTASSRDCGPPAATPWSCSCPSTARPWRAPGSRPRTCARSPCPRSRWCRPRSN